MTKEERERLAKLMEAEAEVPNPDDYREGLKTAARIVREQTAESPWIGVEERLPGPLELVLILTTFGSFAVASRAPDPGTWWADTAGYQVYPTHWMPIPTPPTSP